MKSKIQSFGSDIPSMEVSFIEKAASYTSANGSIHFQISSDISAILSVSKKIDGFSFGTI